MDDADTDFNDMLFFEKQAVQPSSAEKINGNEAYCDARADQTARSAVLFRKIRLFLRRGSGRSVQPLRTEGRHRTQTKAT